ncbi:hypothetical protein ACA910_014611 [Epithemia clementina (nom. ined.)]
MVVFDGNPTTLTRDTNTRGVGATIDINKLYAKKKRFRQKSVRFANEPDAIIRTFSYTDDEKQKCFYEKRERRVFEDDRVRACALFEKKMKSGELWEETKDATLHGLEDFFGLISKEETRKIHVLKVLKEQDRQRKVGEWHDEITIRYVSSESSGDARARALKQGQKHALVVKSFTEP